MYNAFHADFGPLHIGHLYRFAVQLHEVLGQQESENRPVVFWSGADSRSMSRVAIHRVAEKLNTDSDDQVERTPHVFLPPTWSSFSDGPLTMRSHRLRRWILHACPFVMPATARPIIL